MLIQAITPRIRFLLSLHSIRPLLVAPHHFPKWFPLWSSLWLSLYITSTSSKQCSLIFLDCVKGAKKGQNFNIDLSFWRPDFNLDQNVKYWYCGNVWLNVGKYQELLLINNDVDCWYHFQRRMCKVPRGTAEPSEYCACEGPRVFSHSGQKGLLNEYLSQ